MSDTGDAIATSKEQWPNRRIIYLAAVISVIAYLIFRFPAALSRLLELTGDTLVVIILSVAMTYLLVPLHELLMKINWPEDEAVRRRICAVASIVLFIGILVVIFTMIVVPLAQQSGTAIQAVADWASEDAAAQIEKITESIINAVPAEYRPELHEQMDSLQNSFGPDQLQELLNRWGGAILKSQLQLLKTIFSSGAYLLGLVVVPIFSYYFLTDASQIREGVARYIWPDTRESFYNAVRDIDSMLRVYVKTTLVISILTGIGTAVILYLTGVPVYLALGVLAGVGNMIPVVGGLVAIIIIEAISLLTVGVTGSIIVLVIYGAIQFGTDNILRPKLMAEGVGLHPVAIIIALMVGGQFFGMVGVLVSVPVLAAVRLAYRHTRSYLADEDHREDLDQLAGPKKADEPE